MRLVDYYMEALLAARSVSQSLSADDPVSAEELKNKFVNLISSAQVNAASAGVDEAVRQKALFPVVAFIDELILTSPWPGKLAWKNDSLQRHYFETTNAGSEFYEQLNLLNRQGSDADIREIYLMCLGLGFKGRYFMPEDRTKIEEARGYNMSIMLPEDSVSRMDKSTLFSAAYQKDMRENKLMRSRFNLIPVFTAIPFVAVIATFLFYALQIDSWVSNIVGLVS